MFNGYFDVVLSTDPMEENPPSARFAVGTTIEEVIQQVNKITPLDEKTLSVFVNGEEMADYKDYKPIPTDTITIKATPADPISAIAIISAIVTSGIALSIGGFAGAFVGAVLLFGINGIAQVIFGKRGGGVNETAPDFSQGNTITGSRNRLRPEGVIPAILGTHRTSPPLGAPVYTEQEGEFTYLRMLAVVGHAPLYDPRTDMPDATDKEIMDALQLKVGNQLLSEFEDVEMDYDFTGNNLHLPAYDIRTQQENFRLPLNLEETFVHTSIDRDLYRNTPYDWGSSFTPVRRTLRGANEFGVTLTFPSGLYWAGDGRYGKMEVNVQMQYRAVGDEEWIPFSVTGRNKDSNIWNPESFEFDRSIFETPQGSGFALSQSDLRIAARQDRVFTLGDVGRAYRGPNTIYEMDAPILAIHTQNRQPLRVGFRVRHIATNGEGIEVRMRRIPINDNRVGIDEIETRRGDRVNNFEWTSLRSFQQDDADGTRQPVIDRTGLARIALRVRSTETLNGVIDQMNAVVSPLIPVWNGVRWDEREDRLERSSNPAAIFRYILRGPATRHNIPVEDIDEETLGEWYEFCRDHEPRPLLFDGVVDYENGMGDILTHVARAGLATKIFMDDKWSVFIDRPRNESAPVKIFNPSNYVNLQGSVLPVEMPDALRVSFFNKRNDYDTDELLVGDDGFRGADRGEPEPDNIAEFEILGQTDPDNVYMLARRFMATVRHRAESWTFETGNEARMVKVGDLVSFSSDAALIGAQFGRVRSVVGSTVILEEPLTTEEGQEYTIRIARNDGTIYTGSFDGHVGDSPNISLTAPPVTGVTGGEVFSFGARTLDSISALVSRIESLGDDRFRVSVVPYNAAVYNAEMEIPRYEPTIRRPRSSSFNGPPPPVVREIVSESASFALTERGDGQPRVFIEIYDPDPDARGNRVASLYQVRYAPTTTPHNWITQEAVPADGGRVEILGLEAHRSYITQIRSLSAGGDYSPWSPNGTIDTSTRVALVAPTNIRIDHTDAGGILRWDYSARLDSVARFSIRYVPSVEEAFHTGTTEPVESPSILLGETVSNREFSFAINDIDGYFIIHAIGNNGGTGPRGTLWTTNVEDRSVDPYNPRDRLVASLGFGPDDYAALQSASARPNWNISGGSITPRVDTAEAEYFAVYHVYFGTTDRSVARPSGEPNPPILISPPYRTDAANASVWDAPDLSFATDTRVEFGSGQPVRLSGRIQYGIIRRMDGGGTRLGDLVNTPLSALGTLGRIHDTDDVGNAVLQYSSKTGTDDWTDWADIDPAVIHHADDYRFRLQVTPNEIRSIVTTIRGAMVNMTAVVSDDSRQMDSTGRPGNEEVPVPTATPFVFPFTNPSTEEGRIFIPPGFRLIGRGRLGAQLISEPGLIINNDGSLMTDNPRLRTIFNKSRTIRIREIPTRQYNYNEWHDFVIFDRHEFVVAGTPEIYIGDPSLGRAGESANTDLEVYSVSTRNITIIADNITSGDPPTRQYTIRGEFRIDASTDATESNRVKVTALTPVSLRTIPPPTPPGP